jgi:transposase-like protein
MPVSKTMDQQPSARKAVVNRSQTGVVCPRCGHSAARIIGQSDSYAVLYLRCDDCHQTSVAPA